MSVAGTTPTQPDAPRSFSSSAELSEALRDRGIRLGPVLGRGGQGVVFSGLDRAGDAVAVKVIRLSNHAGVLARFMREARMLRAIRHPGVVRLRDAGVSETGAFGYLLLDHLEGRTLRSLMKESPLRLARSLEIVSNLLGLLHVIHEAGVVHRDIKPSNVMMVPSDDGGERPVVFDFGVVRAVDAVPITGNTEIVGTPSYLAPEQVVDFLAVDRRCDLYAVGLLLFRLVSGSFPYSTARRGLYKRIVFERPEGLVLPAERSVVASLNEVVQRALQKLPDDRYGDALAMRSAVDAIRQRI